MHFVGSVTITETKIEYVYDTNTGQFTAYPLEGVQVSTAGLGTVDPFGLVVDQVGVPPSAQIVQFDGLTTVYNGMNNDGSISSVSGDAYAIHITEINATSIELSPTLCGATVLNELKLGVLVVLKIIPWQTVYAKVGALIAGQLVSGLTFPPDCVDDAPTVVPVRFDIWDNPFIDEQTLVSTHYSREVPNPLYKDYIETTKTFVYTIKTTDQHGPTPTPVPTPTPTPPPTPTPTRTPTPTPVPTPKPGAGKNADFTGDGKADAVIRDNGGYLQLVPHTPTSGWGAKKQIGNGWNGMTYILAADFNGDGNADVVARDASGLLWLYPHTPSGFGTKKQIGNGWNIMTQITTGDFDGDGNADIVARDTSGAVWLYPHKPTGFSARRGFGFGFSSDSTLVAGDFSGDGKADVLEREADGRLYLHVTDGTGLKYLTTFVTNVRLFAADYSGDPYADVLLCNSSGSMSLWTYTPSGGLVYNSSVTPGVSGCTALV
jgi:hypothetical protein